MEFTKKTAAEFFSGIGLVRLALDESGWKSVFSNDNDPEKCQMYRQNFPDADEVLSPANINLLHGHNIPDVLLATASFPCNDLSLAGSRGGIDGAQSGAFWHFIKILEEMGVRKPPIVLLENVTGFLTSNKGKDFERAMQALNKLEYACDPFTINASHFVPQSRVRLFVVATAFEHGAKSLESLRPVESEVRPKILTKFIFEHPEIRWLVRSLPRLPIRSDNLEDILEDLPLSSPYWWSQERANYLLNQMSVSHRTKAEAMIAGEKHSYGTVFRRIRAKRSMAELRTDGVAGCLRTPRGGSGRQILFAAGRGDYAARLLTPRECARLQGVPETYVIDVSLNQALFGFGDAVCIPVIKWIANNYLNPVLEEFYRTSDSSLVALHA